MKHRLQVCRLHSLWHMGLAAPRHGGSSQTRDRTRLPYMGRQIPNQWTTKEVPGVGLSLDLQNPFTTVPIYYMWLNKKRVKILGRPSLKFCLPQHLTFNGWQQWLCSTTVEVGSSGRTQSGLASAPHDVGWAFSWIWVHQLVELVVMLAVSDGLTYLGPQPGCLEWVDLCCNRISLSPCLSLEEAILARFKA